jgi:hypothetical protein
MAAARLAHCTAHSRNMSAPIASKSASAVAAMRGSLKKAMAAIDPKAEPPHSSSAINDNMDKHPRCAYRGYAQGAYTCIHGPELPLLGRIYFSRVFDPLECARPYPQRRGRALRDGSNSGKLSLSVIARTRDDRQPCGKGAVRRAPRVYAARRTTAWRPSVNRQLMSGGGRHTRPSRGKRPGLSLWQAITLPAPWRSPWLGCDRPLTRESHP